MLGWVEESEGDVAEVGVSYVVDVGEVGSDSDEGCVGVGVGEGFCEVFGGDVVVDGCEVDGFEDAPVDGEQVGYEECADGPACDSCE